MKLITEQMRYSATQCARLMLVITVAWGVMTSLNLIWLSTDQGRVYEARQNYIEEIASLQKQYVDLLSENPAIRSDDPTYIQIRTHLTAKLKEFDRMK